MRHIRYTEAFIAQRPLFAFRCPQSLLGQPGFDLLESIYVQLCTLGLNKGNTADPTRVKNDKQGGPISS